MISRQLQTNIASRFYKSKAIILLGPRQVGKTTLIKQILNDNDYILLDGDNPTVLRLLNRPDLGQIKEIIADKKIVFIDEAQQIPDIGVTSKLIVDYFPEVQLILSGSSSFELTNVMSEPLTGRKWTYNLWQISWAEWQKHIGLIESEQDLENRLIYGFYPDVLNNPSDKKIILNELVSSYLYKDVLMYGKLKKSDEIYKLLQALAFQVGSEVSYNELSSVTGLSFKTVESYINVLEQAFVIFRLNSFSKNLRNEIRKGRKIYFYDNGVRNAIIGQFSNFNLRNDIGALWENFLVSERKKHLSYNKIFANTYFWRTTQQQEIDYIEEINGNLFAFEFKFNPNKKVKFTSTFTNNYPCETKVINRNNFREFVK